MRHRPSTERQVEWTRWVKDKRGNWRQKTDVVSEVGYCAAITKEPPGFFRGARIR